MNDLKVSFYVVAHQDDWELFRGQQAWIDLRVSNNRTVFIYTTGGDAGRLDGWWEAREQGAIAASRTAFVQAVPLTFSIVNVNNHPIARYQFMSNSGDGGSAVDSASYFFRLPDGNVDGQGFPGTGYESLKKLHDENTPISAVDHSTTYTTWDDFCRTLMAILEAETQAVPSAGPFWVNAPDWDPQCNPDDHSDHQQTAEALLQIYGWLGNPYNRAWFVTYDSSQRPANLRDEELENKFAVFLGYANTVESKTGENGNHARPSAAEWDAWGNKNYYRTVLAGNVDPGCS